MKIVMSIPKQCIDWIVGRIHVGTSDEEVKAEIRKRATGPEWTKAKIMEAEMYAIHCHRKNQELYRTVMSGKF